MKSTTKKTQKASTNKLKKEAALDSIAIPVLYASDYEVNDMIAEMTRYNCDNRLNRHDF